MQTASTSIIEQEEADGYRDLEALIRERIAAATGPLFTTNAKELFGTFLSGLPEDRRQHYTCNCCRKFFERYGGLVTIVGEDGGAEVGTTKSVLWTNTSGIKEPSFFVASIDGLWSQVKAAKVTGVFLSSEKTWGTPYNVAVSPKYLGTTWTHLHGENPNIFKHALKDAGQMMAEKREDYITLKRALAEFPVAVVEQAHRILEADALDRSEKTLGVAKWLLDLQNRLAAATKPAKDNLVWRAVATAPPGFCHVRSTMISTLLDDIVSKLDIDTIKQRWAAKVHPLKYQRPTTLSEGNVKRANEIVEKLASAGALARRFARLEDVTFRLWTPRAAEPSTPNRQGGAFDHLMPGKSAVQPVELPSKVMTWEKFARDVLPTALEIMYRVPYQREGFAALVTAANADAPPILQWDNPVSWYIYHNGSEASSWNLTPGGLWKVTAITLSPPHWTDAAKFSHQNQSLFFLLDGARDLRHTKSGGFFPEQLRSEYHEIRKAMEAYARDAPIAGRDESSASGLMLLKEQNWHAEFRVKSATGLANYRLDRWE